MPIRQHWSPGPFPIRPVPETVGLQAAAGPGEQEGEPLENEDNGKYLHN